ncbi:acyltransferase family protein [Jannaschia sp. LMIT008]|uniref:acyltransferase family protein n=1 Tax=Jannaschia maritima TaxID=3032585 RepID=UPI002810FA55|nr:acyltransferase family protein [Jannaschia sp. LMIT008]
MRYHLAYRADIDGLRALAVVPVLLFHADLAAPGGFVGVDMFFVLSGYLLSRIVVEEAAAGRFGFLRFYERRFRRLAPAFTVVLLSTGAAFAAVMLPDDFVDLARSARAGAFFLANIHFLHTIDYFSQSAELMPLLHLWSLAIEEQFYLALPVCVVVALRILPPRALPWMVGAALVGSFGLCLHYTAAWRPYAFYMPHTRAWELLAGTLLATLPRLAGPRRLADLTGLVALAVLLAVMALYDERDAFPGWRAALPVAATAALIHAGAAHPGHWTARLLSTPPFTFVGRISYSLYLWHWPVMVFANYTDLGPEGPVRGLACIAVSFALATLSWRFVEEPVRRRRVLPTTDGAMTGAVASTALVAMLAWGVIASGGRPASVPDDLRAFVDVDRHATPHPECFHRGDLTDAVPCRRGAPGVAPSFFLIGDSHAHALAPGLFDAAARRGMAGLQFTAPGLFPGLGRRPAGARGDDGRPAVMLQAVLDRPEIETVIVAAAWGENAVGTNWKGARWLFADSEGTARDAAGNAAVFVRSLDRLARALPDRRIVLLDDIPSGEVLDLRTYVRHAMLRGADPEGAVLDRDAVVAQRARYVPLLEDVAARHANVAFRPVLRGFCASPAGCSLFMADGRTPLYRDGDHLSGRGGLSLSPLFGPLLDDLDRTDARPDG